MNTLALPLKTVEKEKQAKSKANRKKKIINIGAYITQIDNESK